MITLTTIEGSKFTWDGTNLNFTGRGRVDDDGTGLSHGDRYHQRDTSLHWNGAPLNADEDRYIVIPMEIIDMLKGIVLGSQAWVTYRGKTYAAVVGDAGPNNRAGEMSISLEKDMGFNPDPNVGGDDNPDINYCIVVGIPAVVNGKQYQLQPS